MTENLPTPTERLLAALDPQGDIDLGLAVVIARPGPTQRRRDRARRKLIRATQPGDDAQRGLLVGTVTLLGNHTSGRLADLVERANADACDRGYRDRAERH